MQDRGSYWGEGGKRKTSIFLRLRVHTKYGEKFIPKPFRLLTSKHILHGDFEGGGSNIGNVCFLAQGSKFGDVYNPLKNKSPV